MSHNTGSVQILGAPIQIGPDTGDAPSPANTWALDFAHTPAPTGSKFVILHFQNVALPAGNRLEVDLGYDTDVFTAADGDQFWTRPVNLYALAGGLVPIRYVTDGAATGVAELDRYGRGESLPGDPGHGSISNSDPFQGEAVYDEPVYDPWWYCGEPPNWENIAAVAPPDVRTQVARSVGMIVTIHGDEVSTCSVTLVDTDKVITAGHCITPAEALTSSVTFDYQTEADGSRPPGYNATFHKVTQALSQRYQGGHDYALLELATSPPGVAPLQMRHDVPTTAEQVFGVHHPNGAPKKLSIPHPGFSNIIGAGPLVVNVGDEFDVSGGSSGSGLFDTAGRIIGVLSQGDPCGNAGSPFPLIYYPTAAFIADTVPAPPPPITRDVMVVIDRSGSMSEGDGTGRTKIEAARDAVSLFVQLVQAGTGNRIGMVSFSSSASSPADFGIADVTDPNKQTLIGNAPYSGGDVGALTPGGATSIGDGLDAARLQFPAPGANPRSILLMTDGMQNTTPDIADVEGDLGSIEVHAIGFGTASNLDGPLLMTLAGAHSGLYMRATDGLALEKFFTEAFGNIFETGILFDPEFDLPADRDGEPISFPVCGEEAITAVVGWDRTDTHLQLEITTPGGAIVTASTAGVEAATGITWSFLRLPLPHGTERDGLWQVRVLRPTIDIPESARPRSSPFGPALRYFLNVVPTGGPRLLRETASEPSHYYTGDAINPIVLLRFADGGWPHHAHVELTLTRPDASTGTILSAAGLQPPGLVNGDVVPALQASMQAVENATGQPIAGEVESSITLGIHPEDTRGRFESGSHHGKAMFDALVVEGTYTLHAKATYGEECQGARELSWSLDVAVGIDPEQTGVTSEPTGTSDDGDECLRLTLTPRDKYGNHLGPGRAGGFEVQPTPGTTVTSAATDLGNGSYRVDVCWDPASGEPPGVGIAQPGRPVVVVTPTDVRRFVYSVKFVCGEQADDCCGCAPVTPGRYATEINLHNPLDRDVAVAKRVIPLVLAGAVRGREPQVAEVAAADRIVLPGHSATMDDCCRVLELLLGAKPAGATPITLGILEIVSLVELSVTAVYTAADLAGGRTSIDVETISPKVSTVRAPKRPHPPHRHPTPHTGHDHG